MAVLDGAQLAELRQQFQATAFMAGVTKPQLNAGVQAIEDWFEANRTALAAAIETAAPGVFSAQQKKKLGKVWLLQKFGRE